MYQRIIQPILQPIQKFLNPELDETEDQEDNNKKKLEEEDVSHLNFSLLESDPKNIENNEEEKFQTDLNLSLETVKNDESVLSDFSFSPINDEDFPPINIGNFLFYII